MLVSLQMRFPLMFFGKYRKKKNSLNFIFVYLVSELLLFGYDFIQNWAKRAQTFIWVRPSVDCQ